ncbi:hypothetical protein HOP52_15230 [Halomonas campisalis]|uniref:Uncharacterized protein n=1 Tax=Billgrantia campisalis TaxID=74661 RepID=A0ABS9PBG1_9GAMM|nr:hypothetical protein [Halomonas campisalis]MCG6659110.1 hypothetical protein [Halomonas campisalis]MDR5863855.1 hypothetical protein [Halomonas campisalis]
MSVQIRFPFVAMPLPADILGPGQALPTVSPRKLKLTITSELTGAVIESVAERARKGKKGAGVSGDVASPYGADPR